MPDHLQLTVDGREERPQAPETGESCEALALFDAPRTIRGQLAIPETDPEGSTMRAI